MCKKMTWKEVKTEQIRARLWDKINSMSDNDLLCVWSALGSVSYNDKDMWDHELEIPMEIWAHCIYEELLKRELPTNGK